jgi:5'(3')-deoxyribonucleotidase
MRIAIDLDDVLCNMRPALLDWHNRSAGTDWAFEDFTSFGLAAAFGISMDDERRIVHQFHTECDHKEIPVVEGSLGAIAKLSASHELYVVTSRPAEGQFIAENWVEHNFPGMFKAVVMANPYSFAGSKPTTKGEICKELGCEILIDDDARHMPSLAEHGVMMLLVSKPWNTEARLEGEVIRVEDWDEAMVALGNLTNELKTT